ncbi:hypothetical protein ACFOZ5_18350 [Marinobacter lacisalsi]|uniref:Uncharacterized protein n=1 Tax=Marinobacter lacisalsi TaxID=475979 RepID=A0ABV8QLA3_9GAMM
MRAPGLSIKQVQGTPPLSPVRGDVAALIGYAARGPRGYPVRLGSWRDFVDVFGEPYGFGHLGTAIKGFFENGGQTCYAVRVTDDSAQAASLTVQGRTMGEDDPAETIAEAVQWTFSPAFKQATASALDREVLDRLGSPHPNLNGPLLLPDPGLWGNELALSISDSRRAVTHLLPGAHAGQTSQAANLDGLEANSLVRLSQPAHAAAGSLLLWVQAVDPIRGLLEWPVELDQAMTPEGSPVGFDLDQAIVLETVDFTLELWLADRRLEQFPHLSLHPEHSRYLVRAINRESRWLQVRQTLGPAADAALGGATVPPASDTGFWPQPLTLARFRGGRDGLGQVAGANFLPPPQRPGADSRRGPAGGAGPCAEGRSRATASAPTGRNGGLQPTRTSTGGRYPWPGDQRILGQRGTGTQRDRLRQ